jgi:small subunit ribosomal protein S1
MPRSTWEEFVARHSVGDIVDARVTRVVPFGALVEMAGGVPGLLVTQNPPHDGERVSVRLEEIDAEKRRVSVSAP